MSNRVFDKRDDNMSFKQTFSKYEDGLLVVMDQSLNFYQICIQEFLNKCLVVMKDEVKCKILHNI